MKMIFWRFVEPKCDVISHDVKLHHLHFAVSCPKQNIHTLEFISETYYFIVQKYLQYYIHPSQLLTASAIPVCFCGIFWNKFLYKALVCHHSCSKQKWSVSKQNSYCFICFVTFRAPLPFSLIFGITFVIFLNDMCWTEEWCGVELRCFFWQKECIQLITKKLLKKINF